MGRKPALVLLTVLSPLLLVGLAVDLAALFWVTIPLVCALPGLLMAVGGGRQGVPPLFIALLWLMLTLSWLGLWGLSLGPSTVLGILLVGLGLAPLVLVGLTFAGRDRWWNGGARG